MQPETLRGTQDAMLATARLFRLGMDTQANRQMVTVVDGLCSWCEAAVGDDATRVSELLADLVAAQERGDVLRIADLLEFELLPRLFSV